MHSSSIGRPRDREASRRLITTDFLLELLSQLLQVTAAGLVDERPQPDPTSPSGRAPTRHKLVGFPEWVPISERVRKRPQYQCKVCSIRKQKVGERRATRFYCETCSDGNRRVYLCDRIRPEQYPVNRLTCHQIWHEMWNNGEEGPPPRVGRDIQMRVLGKRRRNVNDNGDSEDEADGEEEDAEDQDAAEEQEAEAGGEDVGERDSVQDTGEKSAGEQDAEEQDAEDQDAEEQGVQEESDGEAEESEA